MALVQCPECSKEVSDKATTCIHCGYPLRDSLGFAQHCHCCKREIPQASEYCPYCGEKIRESERNSSSADAEKPTSIMAYAEEEAQKARLRKTAPSQTREAAYYPPSSPSEARCPKCGSTSLSVSRKGFGYGKAAAGAVLAGPLGILAGGIGANGSVITCMNCGHKFNPKK